MFLSSSKGRGLAGARRHVAAAAPRIDIPDCEVPDHIVEGLALERHPDRGPVEVVNAGWEVGLARDIQRVIHAVQQHAHLDPS